MQWLTVDELREWCRENDDAETTAMLSAIGTAAEILIAQYLDRPVVASDAELEGKTNAIVADELIKMAAKLLVSHFNEHREAVTDTKNEALPFGFEWILNPYRVRTNC